MDGTRTGRICPYLGRSDDPDSYYAFPADANYCYTKQAPFPIPRYHQASTCLGENWTACPRYKAATGQVGSDVRPTLPPPERIPRFARSTWAVIGAVAVAGIILFGMFMLLRPRASDGQPSSSTSSPAVIQSQSPSAAYLSPSPSPTFTASATWTVTTTPSRAPTVTPSSTPSPTSTATATRGDASPTPTSTGTPTPSPSPMPSGTSSPTASPTGPSPTPGEATATSLPLAAPLLLAPPDGQEFPADARIVLTWQPADELPLEAYYMITVSYTHEGETWNDDVPWTQDTSWTLSEHDYLLALADDSRFRWSVHVVQQTGVGADDKPIGVPLSPPSEVWTLIWKRPPGSEDKPPIKP
jgi:hypothetical protein